MGHSLSHIMCCLLTLVSVSYRSDLSAQVVPNGLQNTRVVFRALLKRVKLHRRTETLRADVFLYVQSLQEERRENLCFQFLIHDINIVFTLRN